MPLNSNTTAAPHYVCWNCLPVKLKQGLVVMSEWSGNCDWCGRYARLYKTYT